MAALFAFDFMVEKLRDVREKDQIHAIAFKLLGFPAVSVAIANGRKHPSGTGLITIRLYKGKSVVFERDPKELVQGLKETPVEVCLLSSGNALTSSYSSWPAPWVGRGVVDLSDMAVSLESAVMPESLHQNKGQLNRCTFSSRDTIELTDGAGKRVARVRLKCRLAYVSDNIPQKVYKPSSQMSHEHSEAPDNENETSPKREDQEESEERGCGSLLPTPDPSPTPVHAPSPQPGEAVAITDHLNRVTDDVYLPNSACPPPLFYHSKSKANEHPHTKPHPPSSERAMYSAPPCTHSVWCESTAQGEGYDHWSVLARYDQSTHPLTTRFRDLNPPMEDVLPEDAAAALSEEPVLIRHLPLLSGLLEELSCLHSRVEPSLLARKSPEKVSTSVQTESMIMAEKPDVRPTGRKKRIRFIHNTTRGRFVRECCQPAKPKLVPRNKSVLYPPDIHWKRRRVGFAKDKLKGRDLTIPSRQLPAYKERATVAVSGKVVRRKPEGDHGFTTGDKPKPTKPAGGVSSPVRKLEVFIPHVPWSPSSSSSPSLSKESSPSTTSPPTPSKGSTIPPALPRSEISALNAETQTEGVEEEKDVASVLSVQTDAVDAIEGPELPETPEEERLESKEEKLRKLSVQSTESPVMLINEDFKQENGAREFNNQPLATAASQKEPLVPVPQSEEFTVEPDKAEEASSPQSVDSARYVQSTRTSPSIHGNKWRQRRGSDVVQSLSKFNLSRHKFSSVGDVSTVAESPLIHSMRKSLPCVLETTASNVDLNALTTVRSRSHDIGSQTFDSFTDMLEMGDADGRSILLKKRLGNSLVYLASSQSTVASEEGWGDGRGEREEGVVTEEEEEREGAEEEVRMEGERLMREEEEGLGLEVRVAEAGEGSDQEVDYSDDFEYSDTFEDTSSSTDND